MNFTDAINHFLSKSYLDVDIDVFDKNMRHLFKFNSWSFGNGHFVEYFNFPRKLKKHEKITHYDMYIRNFVVYDICADLEVLRIGWDKEKAIGAIVLKDDLNSYRLKKIRDVIKKAGHL